MTSASGSTAISPRAHLNTGIAALMELVNELYAFTDRIAPSQRRSANGKFVHQSPHFGAATKRIGSVWQGHASIVKTCR